MSLLRRLAAFLGLRREVDPPPLAPPHAGAGIPVAAVGDAAPAELRIPPRPPARAALVVPELLEELGAADPQGWAEVLSSACLVAEIRNRRRLAAFLGNALHETGGLRRMRESLDYSAEGLARTWPARFALPGTTPPQPNAQAWRLGRHMRGGVLISANQPAIAAAAYAGRLGNRDGGDAWRFRGAGLLQLTGRENWQRAAEALGLTLEELERTFDTRHGAAATAGLFWQWKGCNALADAGELEELRRRVNGGAIGLEAVREITAQARDAIARRAPWVPA